MAPALKAALEAALEAAAVSKWVRGHNCVTVLWSTRRLDEDFIRHVSVMLLESPRPERWLTHTRLRLFAIDGAMSRYMALCRDRSRSRSRSGVYVRARVDEYGERSRSDIRSLIRGVAPTARECDCKL